MLLWHNIGKGYLDSLINKQACEIVEDELTFDILTDYGFKVLEISSKDRIQLSKGDFFIVIIALKVILYTRSSFYYPIANLTDRKVLYENVQHRKLTVT